jgi:hypothetical protein
MTGHLNTRSRARLIQTWIIFGWVIFTLLASSLAFNRLDTLWSLLFEAIPLGVSVAVLVLMGLGLFWVTWSKAGTLLSQIRAQAFTLSQDELQEMTERTHAILGISLVPADFKDDTRLEAHLATFGTDLARAVTDEGRATFGSWQQPLRLLHHLPQIRALWVIDNSAGDYKRFAKVMHHFRPDLHIVRIEDRGYRPGPHEPLQLTVQGRPRSVDYEDFDFVLAAIRRGLVMVAEHAGIDRIAAEAQTLLDVTPGQKPLSIAAAIASLNRRLIFVYVSNHGRVAGYDASVLITNEG